MVIKAGLLADGTTAAVSSHSMYNSACPIRQALVIMYARALEFHSSHHRLSFDGILPIVTSIKLMRADGH